MPIHALTVRSLHARALSLPMTRPIQTGGGSVAKIPLVLVDLETEEGITGCSYIFCYAAFVLEPLVKLLHNLGDLIKGDAVTPLALEEKLQRAFRLLGPQGFTAMAAAGIDSAAWDACAKAADLPLFQLLGGKAQPIPAYNRTGLGIIGAERASDEARALVEPGFKAIKVRLGYPDTKTDVEVVRAVRNAISDNIALMSDYNQALSVPEAVQRAQALDGEGLSWIEEPTRADDYAGYAHIRQSTQTPIQLGENFWGPHDMAKAIAAGSGDFLMPDVNKIGGVSGWLRAIALAGPSGIPISSHLYPEISAHLLAVTPTRHWLEYMDWADPFLQEPTVLEDGKILPSSTPGTGLAWNEQAVAKYLV